MLYPELQSKTTPMTYLTILFIHLFYKTAPNSLLVGAVNINYLLLIILRTEIVTRSRVCRGCVYV